MDAHWDTREMIPLECQHGMLLLLLLSDGSQLESGNQKERWDVMGWVVVFVILI